MNDHYQCELEIEAPAAAVYEALTTPRGLRGWWTGKCEIGTRVGEHSTFRFGQTFKVMRIESLQPDDEVRWHCVKAHIHAPDLLSRTNEWEGTSIGFRLTAKTPHHTLLKVEHLGLTPAIECYGICTAGWNQFLGSLKSYVETGRGMPFVSPA